MSSVNKTRRFTQLALFVSMAMVLSYMERFFPILPSFPGVKLGLANIITLMVLLMYSWKEALDRFGGSRYLVELFHRQRCQFSL